MDDAHLAHNMAVIVVLDDRHEVGHLSDAVFREKTRDQDVGIREVELLGSHRIESRLNAEEPAFVRIKQGSKDSRRIELRKAKEINRSRHADQRNRSHVSDDAVVFNRLVFDGGQPLVFTIEMFFDARRMCAETELYLGR